MFYLHKMKLILGAIAALLLAGVVALQSTLVFTASAASAAPSITVSGAIGTHDPSRIIKDGNKYYVYSTGGDIPSKVSTDRIHWTNGKNVLTNGTPAWARTLLPGNGGHDVWAPDVIYNPNSKLFDLYYALSGGKPCAIGLLTSPTLDQSASNYKWTDRGPVVTSASNAVYAAIDPAPYFDASGNLWLSFGSGYTHKSTDPEIYEIRLNKTTGLRSDNVLHAVENGHIEASYVVYHSGFYYLFWNSGGCCSGAASTYLIHEARSKSPTGPYVDKNGKANSSSPFLGSHGGVHGPGQLGVLIENGIYYYSYHYYPNSGGSVLGEGVLNWASNGWPIAN